MNTLLVVILVLVLINTAGLIFLATRLRPAVPPIPGVVQVFVPATPVSPNRCEGTFTNDVRIDYLNPPAGISDFDLGVIGLDNVSNTVIQPTTVRIQHNQFEIVTVSGKILDPCKQSTVAVSATGILGGPTDIQRYNVQPLSTDGWLQGQPTDPVRAIGERGEFSYEMKVQCCGAPGRLSLNVIPASTNVINVVYDPANIDCSIPGSLPGPVTVKVKGMLKDPELSGSLITAIAFGGGGSCRTEAVMISAAS